MPTRRSAIPGWHPAFAHDYRLAIVTAAPPGVRILDVPATVAPDAGSWFAHVTPARGAPFVARVNTRQGAGFATSGAWSTPNPSIVALVQNGAGMLVDTRDPLRRMTIPGGVLCDPTPVPEARALTFVDAEHLVVVTAWRTWMRVVMNDELRIVRTSGTRVTLEGRDVGREPARRTIDLAAADANAGACVDRLIAFALPEPV